MIQPSWKKFAKLFFFKVKWVKVKSLSRVQLFATRGLWPTKFLRPWDSPGKNTGVGCHFLSSRPRDQTQVSHIAGRRFNLCTTREALKSKEERKPGWKKGEEEKGGSKRGGLTDVSCHLQISRHYGTFPWAPEKGGLELSPTRNQTRTRIRVLCQEEVISLQSSAQAEGPSTRFLRPGLGE